MKDLSIKKLYYSISEVSKLTGIEQYILRYWETEFEQLKPQKNRAGNRIYTNKDIQLILYIKNLLRERKYTIEGAKKILENYSSEKLTEEQPQTIETEVVKSKVEEVNPGTRDKQVLKKDLEELKNLLEFFLAKL
ncbi:Putative transcriptional regulator [Ignavibacterium album JCM 16511]|uniref:Putative transcriptional regulator n=1 Tax=Ignavibacterium album (strain DSM 19864 / JCM 16511 / NBRC 101810 / Mat9-16) TaxID=945713 RepID=I0AJY2_IGNAJ|nr:MerR family transcriptional regulator [Ignavibacterium album]AFH49289.1 Putative transcriptional regulator [Ignavibacterium album JCM 16511]